ncbi:MAG TPA: hypothetical protein VE999_18250 [Gemmataceae bacterium]|nr:hypothetical protein [Gemmataceae bacterium]
MSRMTTQYPERVYSTVEERPQRGLLEREGVRRPGLLLAGLAVVGLGALAWYYFGPELRRYIKVSRM